MCHDCILRHPPLTLSPVDTKRWHPPSHSLFTLLLSGKRYRSVHCRTTRLQSSFTPEAVTLLNSSSSLSNIDVAGLKNSIIDSVFKPLLYVMFNISSFHMWTPVALPFHTCSVQPGDGRTRSHLLQTLSVVLGVGEGWLLGRGCRRGRRIHL